MAYATSKALNKLGKFMLSSDTTISEKRVLVKTRMRRGKRDKEWHSQKNVLKYWRYFVNVLTQMFRSMNLSSYPKDSSSSIYSTTRDNTKSWFTRMVLSILQCSVKIFTFLMWGDMVVEMWKKGSYDVSNGHKERFNQLNPVTSENNQGRMNSKFLFVQFKKS